jgi:tyrosine-specific transport protein
MDKKFWATTFTLTGTIIGAGILGLPYVFSQSGIFIGLFWLFILGMIMIYTNLCLGEITLRTKGRHQLVGYAEKYLGKNGKKIMFFAVVFGVYSALIAYLIGEGQSLSQLFTGSVDYAIYFAIGFWLLMTILLREGLKGLKKIELWGVITIIVLVLVIAVYFAHQIDVDNFLYNDFSNVFLPFGVILFALLGFSSIPELRVEIKGSEKKFRKAIIIGTLIPIILYIIFSLTFVGVLGDKVSRVATLSFGNMIVILGIFTMLTSYFVLSFSLKDVYKYDLKVSKRVEFLLVSLFPLLIYLGLYYLDKLNFVSILGLGGVISGGLTGILILLMALKVKDKGNRVAEYGVWINRGIVVVLGLIFIGGIVTVLFF